MDSQREIISRRMAQEEHNKRIKHLKRLIVVGMITLLVLPTICCFIFMFRLNRVERQMDNLMMLYNENYEEYARYMDEKNNGVVYAAENLATEEPQVQETEKPKETSKPEAPEGKKVYLTFDDGPSIYTEKILSILKKNDVKATFFVIGKTDDYSKEMYQKIVEEGHTLAMHSYSHEYSSIYSSVKAFKKDLQKIETLLTDVTGQKPQYYRFPGGSSNTVSKIDMKKFISCLNEEGITYFDWNVINGDAVSKTVPKDELVNNVITGIKNYETSVVLMHDAGTKGTTVEALPEIIKKIKKQGANILPIDESTKVVQHVKSDSVD